jgi:uncharacterized protein YjbI with pentapeptide repeats
VTVQNPVGCRGIHVTGHTACLTHLDDITRAVYLSSLEPGADVDHRGTTFDERLLGRLLDALRDPATGQARLGRAQFQEAAFTGDACFDRAVFADTARFDRAAFAGTARFSRVAFAETAQFDQVTFSDTAWFDRVTFADTAHFNEAAFAGTAEFVRTSFADAAGFGRATFAGNAEFGTAAFSGVAYFAWAVFAGAAGFSRVAFAASARFDRAAFSGRANFRQAAFAAAAWFPEVRFEAARQLGPLGCRGQVFLDHAVFGAPVTVNIVCQKLSLRHTRWESTVALRLRNATVDLSGAVLERPMTLVTEPPPFGLPRGVLELDGTEAPGAEPDDMPVQVVSLRGVDAAHLSLTDVDLSICQFSGAVHLDQVTLSGDVRFARPPTGWHRRGVLPMRWSSREVLTEEHHWRAATAGHPEQGVEPAAGDWHPRPDTNPLTIPGPKGVAALYRQLRKALEDGKNEPGAADFYYGEMEMRRHDHTGTTRAERALLTAYWAVSGYGLRASRALAWLGVAMAASVLAMMLWGLPAEQPRIEIAGVQTGDRIELTHDSPAPVNPSGPVGDRLSTVRFEQAVRVVINSVVFRSSGQDLTTTGTYTEMASRFAEPVLLGLVVLALRARVKR